MCFSCQLGASLASSAVDALGSQGHGFVWQADKKASRTLCDEGSKKSSKSGMPWSLNLLKNWFVHSNASCSDALCFFKEGRGQNGIQYLGCDRFVKAQTMRLRRKRQTTDPNLVHGGAKPATRKPSGNEETGRKRSTKPLKAKLSSGEAKGK